MSDEQKDDIRENERETYEALLNYLVIAKKPERNDPDKEAISPNEGERIYRMAEAAGISDDRFEELRKIADTRAEQLNKDRRDAAIENRR